MMKTIDAPGPGRRAYARLCCLLCVGAIGACAGPSRAADKAQPAYRTQVPPIKADRWIKKALR